MRGDVVLNTRYNITAVILECEQETYRVKTAKGTVMVWDIVDCEIIPNE